MDALVSLQGLEFSVRLGYSDAERAVPQPVRFDLIWAFAHPPKACVTDRLDDTVCYAEVSSRVQQVCERDEFRMIEKLGADVYRAVKELLPASARLRVTTTKVHPPIPQLKGGASFIFGESFSDLPDLSNSNDGERAG